MTIFNLNQLSQSLALASSLSLLSNIALAQGASSPSAAPVAPPSNPLDVKLEGRAGIATLCIETRSYVDVTTKKLVIPNIYIKAMPKEGINTGYVEGNPASVNWKEFLNPTDPKRKEWLAETDIPDQAKAAFDLMKRMDKDKNGIVTPEEFEKGEKGKSKEDRDTDLAFLTSLSCNNLFFTEGPLHTINLDAFPEVTSLKKDLTASEAKAINLHGELEESQTRSNVFLGLGIAGASLAFGIGLLLGRRNSRAKPLPAAQKPLPETPKSPEPEKIKLVKPDNTKKAAAETAPEKGYADLLDDLDAPPAENVLAALQEPAPKAAADENPAPEAPADAAKKPDEPKP